jgi:hypothetical protein
MSLPLDTASSTPVVSLPLAPDGVTRLDRLVDYERGGVALNDASQGVNVRNWRAYVDGTNVCVAPYPENTPVSTLFSAVDITELSLAFDQLMHPTIAYVQAGVTKLYWYDTVVSGQVTTTFPDTTSPMLCLDDKRDLQVQAGVTDVLFFYVSGGNLCYRQQRDRFGVERALAALPSGTAVITGVGMGTNNRVQVYMNAPPAVYRDNALGDGAAISATWRSRIMQVDDQPSMAWGRVEASAYPVVLVVQADGTEKTVAVGSDAPFRLPPVRGRTWQIEVRGSSRVQAVILAGSREELEGNNADDLQV